MQQSESPLASGPPLPAASVTAPPPRAPARPTSAAPLPAPPKLRPCRRRSSPHAAQGAAVAADADEAPLIPAYPGAYGHRRRWLRPIDHLVKLRRFD